MKTRAYRNLNNGLWSLKQRVGGKWVVVGHCESLVLMGAEPFVSLKSRERLLPNKQREVHAWIEGDLCRRPKGFVAFQGRGVEHAGFAWDMLPADGSEITYHPFERDCFFFRSHDGEYIASDFALFTSQHTVEVA